MQVREGATLKTGTATQSCASKTQMVDAEKWQWLLKILQFVWIFDIILVSLACVLYRHSFDLLVKILFHALVSVRSWCYLAMARLAP